MTAKTITAGYLLLNLVVFAVGVHVYEIREMGLYLFVMLVGAPASVVVGPLSESLALSVGWSLGSLPHVWVADLMCAFTNAGLPWAFYLAVERVRKRRRHGTAS